MIVFWIPFLLIFLLVAGIRQHMYRPSFLISYERKFVLPSFYRRNTNNALILTILFGSFGLLHANFVLAFLFFVINSFLYYLLFFLVFWGAHPIVFIIFSTLFMRFMNIIVLLLFSFIRSKMHERKFQLYIKETLSRDLNIAYYEKDKHLSEEELEIVRKERLDEEKLRLYKEWEKPYKS